jgi:dTDP-4-dehydrorhamnose 3,5-epimerase
MKITHPDIKIFNHDVYHDYRGELWTTWKNNEYPNNLKYNHDKVSTSRQHVLRGIHGDFKSWKLVECLYGELYFVIVDNRKDSPNYQQWQATILSDKKRQSLLIPPGFGNGFLVMSKESVFHYKWHYSGEYFDVDKQFTLKWNCPNLNINWPIDNPILQQRDK